MRIQLIVFLLLFTTFAFGQVEAQRYTEDEIAIQDKYVEAKKYVLIGRFEKAEEILKQLYKENRTNSAISMELSKVYSYMEDPYNEHKYAKTAANNDSQNEYVLANYADICFRQEKYDEAVIPLKNLVKINNVSEEYSDKLASTYLQQNKADDAISVYNSLESNIGVSENVSRRKYEIYEILGKQEKALKELENLAIAFPYEIPYKQNLASYYTKLGKSEKALTTYRDILKLDINDVNANMAITTASTGDGTDNNYLRSLSSIIENKSIAVDRKVLELVPYIAKMYEENDKELVDAMIMLADKITVIHPKEAKAHALFGDVLMAAKRPKDAIKAYEHTLILNDNVYPVWEGLMEAYSDTEDYANLLRLATDALDFFPNKPSAYKFFGRANSLNGNAKEAIEILLEGVLVSGKDQSAKSNIHAELARAYSVQNDIISAEKQIQTALYISNNKNPFALEIAGDILLLKGDKGSAILNWKKARSLGLNSILLDRKIEQQKL